MEKCNPVETRKNLEAANKLAKAGFDFVAIPVHGHFNKNVLLTLMMQQLNAIEKDSK